jgi:glutamate synthase (NADPH/NADH) large chain
VNPGDEAVSIDDVEPASELFKRFDTAAMSIGALSPEAHEALAEAMNSIGGNSNSGEGGEDPARYGTNKVSRIKQVASGRFGVTPAYLVNADVIQIKVAQGANRAKAVSCRVIKSPVHRQTALFRTGRDADLPAAAPRYLLYRGSGAADFRPEAGQPESDDLREAGFRTGRRHHRHRRGQSLCGSDHHRRLRRRYRRKPALSVKYAGCPWELGLVETQQALVANGLRHKIRLQVDGGLKTGLDIIKAAILGAESFGFGTGPMVALGCKYLRICHLNNCATGVATQDDKLRKNHYHGLPFKVTNYFEFIARETRELMAQLGVKRLVDLIGRTDLLKELDGFTAKQQKLDLSKLLETAEPHPAKRCTAPRTTRRSITAC